MSKFLRCMDELSKFAYGPEAMGKVLKRFKDIQIKSPSMNQYGGGIGGQKGLNQTIGSARQAGHPESAIQAAIPDFKSALTHMRPEGPTTFTTVKGDGIDFLQRSGLGQETLQNASDMGVSGIRPESFSEVAKNPSHRKTLDAVLKGHELAETQVKPNQTFAAFGHRSPDVILREHNMIQTLPKDQAPVADLMRSLRAPGETAALRGTTGFEFGQGPRISRHARKHLTQLHSDEAIRQARASGLLPQG